MDVVGHDNKAVQCDADETLGEFVPLLFEKRSKDRIIEMGLSSIGAYGYKIGSF
jgi:hypothetical protein